MKVASKIIMIFLCIVMIGNVFAQNAVRGKVVDSMREPIEGVAVVMQTIDSIFVDASITDSLGCFTLKSFSDSYRLITHHILYKTLYKECARSDIGTLILQEKNYELTEVVVKGERPQMKVQGNVLSYDATLLLENRPISNAQEALLQVPGVVGSENSISLMGANSLHITINGKMNTMSREQLISLLKSYPASQIKKIEVMYNAPSKYGVRGAVINLELKKTTEESFMGEVSAKMIQSRYLTRQINGNLLFSTAKMNLDLLTNYSKGKDYSKSITQSQHQLYDNVFEISQENTTISSFDHTNFRLGYDYNINNTSAINSSYYYEGKWTDSELKAQNSYPTSIKNSINDEYSKNHLHNVHMQYDLKTDKVLFSLGGDYLGYLSPSNAHFIIKNELYEEENNFNYKSRQSIDQWNLFSNIGYNFSQIWNINIGASSGHNTSHTNMDYFFEGMHNNQHEYKQKESVNRFFIETNGGITKKIMFTIGVECEYFKSDFNSGGEYKNLWKECTLFPKFSMNYFINDRNMLQFNLLNNKIYPSYWAVSPLTTYTDSYTMAIGNPALKPYREYSGQILYIAKQKYVFILGSTYMPNYFAQIPYQSKDELKTIYRYENYDFSLFSNLTTILPFKIGTWVDSRVSLHALRIQDKMNSLYETSFNNEAYVGAIGINNTITVPKSSLSFQLNGRYQSPAIQGIYKLGHTLDCSFSCKYSLNKNAFFFLQANNIFLDRSPNPFKIDFDGQYSVRRIKELADISLQFIWKFGNYKSKEYRQVDPVRLHR